MQFFRDADEMARLLQLRFGLMITGPEPDRRTTPGSPLIRFRERAAIDDLLVPGWLQASEHGMRWSWPASWGEWWNLTRIS
jgi:hypothetical protein